MSKQFAEFKINETFSLESTSSGIDGDKINPKEGTTPYITRGINENGIRQYVTDAQPGNWKKDKGNVITIGLDTQTAYYQPVPFITGQNIHVLSHESMSQRVAMYIVPQLKKLMLKYSWGGNGATLGRLSQDTLVLPVTDTTANTSNPEPDWEYMENYIETIEQKYIDQIAEHNSKEQVILEQLHPESIETKPEAHGFEEIRVGDFIEFSKGKRVTSAEQLPGNIPYVTAATESNGIDAWISNPIFTDKDLATVNFFGKCFYHPYPVAFKDGTYGMRFKDVSQATSRHYFYFMTALEKVSMRKGSYAQMLTDDLAAELHVRMPITPAGEIDWDYMEQYITWIETRERE